MATVAAPVMSKLSKAKARLLMEHPFFACLLIRTQVLVTDNFHGHPIHLAATNGENIFFNPDFLDKLSVEDTMAVLCHEVGHDSLLHSLRLGMRNPDDWNRAGDHAINLMLEDQGFSAPKAMGPGGWLADRKYKGWSADRIYDDIRRERQAQPKPQPGQGKPGQGDPGDGGDEQGDDSSGQPGQGQPGGGQPQPGNGAGGGQPKDWLHGDVLPSPVRDAAEQAVAERRAKQKLASAANMARMAGKLKGDLARMVDEFLDNKVHWTDVLRDYMLKVVKARDSWQRRNRRFKQVYLPTRYEKKMGPIIFIPDSSGSMWGDDMEKICSEMAHCADQTRPEHIRVVWADTQVSSEQVFDPTDFAFKKLKPTGGGGTDMRVPLKHVEKYEPQVVVLMTDGYTPWPQKEPPFPLIVICTTDANCPIGQVIRI